MMDLLTESTDYYDIVFYPDTVDQLQDKQGVTIKGKSDELARAIGFWQSIIASKDSK